MQIVMTLLIGLIAGGLAKLIMPGKDPGGVLVTLVIGVAGSFIAGMLGQGLGWYRIGDGPGILASAGGAVILLAIYRLVAGWRARTAW